MTDDTARCISCGTTAVLGWFHMSHSAKRFICLTCAGEVLKLVIDVAGQSRLGHIQ